MNKGKGLEQVILVPGRPLMVNGGALLADGVDPPRPPMEKI